MRLRRCLLALALATGIVAATSTPSSAEVSIQSAAKRPPGACLVIPILNIALCY